MKVAITGFGDPALLARKEFTRLEGAVTRGVRGTTEKVKLNWRGQVASSLGTRLGNAVRGKTYPERTTSANAGGLVYTKAPEIISAHDAGVTITAKRGLWLAIPLPAAGKAARGATWTPTTWQAAKFTKLRFVPLRGNRAMLVADNAQIVGRGSRQGQFRRNRRANGAGAATVPIFILVRRVKLPKRMDLIPEARRIAAGLPAAIYSQV